MGALKQLVSGVATCRGMVESRSKGSGRLLDVHNAYYCLCMTRKLGLIDDACFLHVILGSGCIHQLGSLCSGAINTCPLQLDPPHHRLQLKTQENWEATHCALLVSFD